MNCESLDYEPDMLFHVHMRVTPPQGEAQGDFERLKIEEKKFSQKLQRKGTWRHLWRIVGAYENISIFDVTSNEELHTILSGLPLFPFMAITVTALAQHPSAINSDSSGTGAE
jgi:muconolactone D-isomerase